MGSVCFNSFKMPNADSAHWEDIEWAEDEPIHPYMRTPLIYFGLEACFVCVWCVKAHKNNQSCLLSIFPILPTSYICPWSTKNQKVDQNGLTLCHPILLWTLHPLKPLLWQHRVTATLETNICFAAVVSFWWRRLSLLLVWPAAGVGGISVKTRQRFIGLPLIGFIDWPPCGAGVKGELTGFPRRCCFFSVLWDWREQLVKRTSAHKHATFTVLTTLQ